MKPISSTPLSAFSVPVFLLLLAGGFLFQSQHFDAASRAMPQLIGRAMVLLATLDLISRTNTVWGKWLARLLNPGSPFERPEARSTGGTLDKVRRLFYMLWILAFALSLIAFGVILAIPLFLFLSLVWVGRRSLRESIFVVCGVSGFVWILFVALLHLDLFPGLYFGGQW